MRPTQVPRRFVFRHPLVRRAVYESTRGGWRLAAHARAAAALAARGAAPAERAHHVEQSAGQGDEEAIGLLLEAGGATAPRAPAAAARWFDAALRLLPAGDSERQADVRVCWRRRCGRWASSSAAGTRCSRRWSCCPGDDTARRVELTALCAAVEHWLGATRRRTGA